MKVGYARVSTQDQNLRMQLDALKEAGCEKIFTDKQSGKDDDRPGLTKALNFVRSGDTLLVFKLDRLSRSLPSLLKIVNQLKDRGTEFTSLHEKIQTDSAGGSLIFHIFAALSQFERELISERTKIGLEAARRRGKFGGRPKVIDEELLDQIKKMYSSGISVKTISKQLNISCPTIYRYLNKQKGG